MVIGFAHRGGRTEHRDNSLSGFARALALGAKGLESDAWVTADGVAVLDHDGGVRRGLRRQPIRSLRREALPDHIPTLGDLYALPGADTVEVSLDVKDPAAAAAVLDAARGRTGRLWLCAGSLPTLAGWRGADAGVHLVHSSAIHRLGRDPGAHPARLAAAGVDALNLRAGEWSPALVAACHESGVRAFGWDAQRRKVIEALVAMGIDGVYSDHVAMMVGVLRSEQLDAAERPHPQDRPPHDQVP